MKVLILISWAIGLTQCDKLDRTYLPPPNSAIAGGHPEDLNLPLRFLKKDNQLIMTPGTGRLTSDGSSISNPDISLGIHRQIPSATGSAETFTIRPGLSFSKDSYNKPSTITPYTSTQITTILPIKSYYTTEPGTTDPQDYSSTKSTFDPNLSYDQHLIQQITNPNRQQDQVPFIDSNISVPNYLNKNIVESYTGSQIGNPIRQNQSVTNNINKYKSEPQFKIGAPNSQISNTDYTISTNISPKLSPEKKYGDGLNILSDNQQLQAYSTQKTISVPEDISVGTLATDAATPSPKYSSSPIPSSSNDDLRIRYDTYSQPQRTQNEADRNAVIVNYENILTPEGFAYSFDTSNGIHADESGTAINGVKAKGSYSFTGHDGIVYTVEYTADENGFSPRGDHLPTAPPIPDVILRGIQLAEKNKQLGLIDDGSYDDEKYGHARYEGFKGRMPQNRINNNIIINPSSTALGFNNKEISTENENFPGSYGTVMDDTYFNGEVDLTAKSPNMSKMPEIFNKDLYITRDNKVSTSSYPSTYQPNENNKLSYEDLNNFNVNKQFIAVPTNKFKGDSVNSVHNDLEELVHVDAEDRNNSVRIPTNTGIFNDMHRIVTSQKQNNVDKIQSSHIGYEYTQPQKIFNDDYRNNLSRFSNKLRDNSSKPGKETQSGKNAPKSSSFDESFNFKNEEPDLNLQILRTSFKDPETASYLRNSNEKQNINFSTTIEPRPSTFYHEELEKIIDNKNPLINSDKKYSTIIPEYASPKIRNNYQSPYASNERVSQRNNYPTSRIGTDYSSTTPLPSEISSRLTSSTSGFNYPQTTPTPSQVRSTLTPSIVSGSRGTTSRPPGLPRNISGQGIDFKTMGTEPNISLQRGNVRPRYPDRSDTTFGTQESFYDELKPKFVISADPNTQVSSSADKFEMPSSNVKVIGEDFRGPNQPQRYDPKYGYYY